MEVKDISEELEAISEKIRVALDEKDGAREKCLKDCREIIRLSSTSIRAIHRREKEKAAELISAAERLVRKTQKDVSKLHPDLLSANYIHDSFKEYAEASITFAVIFERSIPDPDRLRVAYPAYLNGLAESVGEMRRFVLDSLRSHEFSVAEELLAIMDHIYTVLVTMDFPDAITCGLRRNTDSARGIIEKTRGDLTLLISNDLLQKKISLLERKIR